MCKSPSHLRSLLGIGSSLRHQVSIVAWRPEHIHSYWVMHTKSSTHCENLQDQQEAHPEIQFMEKLVIQRHIGVY